MSKTYQITISLASPLYQKTFGTRSMIMLDALLARIKLERQGIRKTSAELLPENLIFVDLPIERVEKCYLCSAHFASKDIYSRPDSFSKRATDAQTIKSMEPSFLTTGAVGHPALIPHIAVATKSIDFYARIPDGREKEFFDLLKDVKLYGVGPKTSIGYGQVAHIDAHVYNAHPDLCYKTEDGIPTRPLPIKLFMDEFKGKGVPSGFSCYYAPYWFHKNQVPCFLPKPEQYVGKTGFPNGLFKDLRTSISFEKKKQASC